MRRLLLIAAAVAAAAVWPTGPTQAAGTAVVAGPGAARTGEFATPVMAVRPGDQPLLANLDTTWHGIESEDAGPDDRPWCTPLDPARPEGPANPRRYPLGQCPLFWADFAVVAGTSPILGLEGVEPGLVYQYRCTVFPGMAGSLFVV